MAANAAGASDTNDGLAQTHEGGTRGPWLTIGHAATTMQAGDTTHVLAGTYTETVQFTRSGAAGAPITLSGSGSDQVIIDGGGTGDATVLLDPEVGYVTIEELTVQNSGAIGIGAGPPPVEPGQPLDTRRSNEIVIRNVQVDGYTWAGILLHNADQFTLDGVLTDHGGSVGVLLEGCAQGTVENSTFRNNPTPPGAAHGLETQRGHHITIRNCTAYNNQNFGFDISVYPHVPRGGTNCDHSLDEVLAWVGHDIVVEECLAYDNGNAGFVANNGSYDIVFRRNVAWRNGASGWGGFLTYEGAYNLTYEHNVAIGNEGLGFMVETPATATVNCLYGAVRPGNTITYRNNITHGNRDGALVVEGSSGQWNIVSQHNDWDILASQTDAVEIMGARYTRTQINDGAFGTGDISADPLFVDVNAAPPDVHLQTGSPCINTGLDFGRPYEGSAPDMGRHEH